MTSRGSSYRMFLCQPESYVLKTRTQKGGKMDNMTYEARGEATSFNQWGKAGTPYLEAFEGCQSEIVHTNP